METAKDVLNVIDRCNLRHVVTEMGVTIGTVCSPDGTYHLLRRCDTTSPVRRTDLLTYLTSEPPTCCSHFTQEQLRIGSARGGALLRLMATELLIVRFAGALEQGKLTHREATIRVEKIEKSAAGVEHSLPDAVRERLLNNVLRVAQLVPAPNVDDVLRVIRQRVVPTHLAEHAHLDHTHTLIGLTPPQGLPPMVQSLVSAAALAHTVDGIVLAAPAYVVNYLYRHTNATVTSAPAHTDPAVNQRAAELWDPAGGPMYNLADVLTTVAGIYAPAPAPQVGV